jgi:hypothetical protein
MNLKSTFFIFALALVVNVLCHRSSSSSSRFDKLLKKERAKLSQMSRITTAQMPTTKPNKLVLSTNVADVANHLNASQVVSANHVVDSAHLDMVADLSFKINPQVKKNFNQIKLVCLNDLLPQLSLLYILYM